MNNEMPQQEQPVVPENCESEHATEEPILVTPTSPTPVVGDEVRHSFHVRQPTKVA